MPATADRSALVATYVAPSQGVVAALAASTASGRVADESATASLRGGLVAADRAATT